MPFRWAWQSPVHGRRAPPQPAARGDGNAGEREAMSRADIRELPMPSTGMQRGEVVVPTYVGDPVHGRLSCPAAPLVAGSLRARGRPVRIADLRGEESADADARLYLVTCPREEGDTAAVAAAAPPGDALSAAAARAAVEEWAAVCANRSLLLAGSPWCSGALHAGSAAIKAASDHEGTGHRVYVLTPAAMPPETVIALSDLGATVTESLEGVEPDAVVVFPAHGVTAQLRAEAARLGVAVVDATCPIVATAQAAAGRAADRGHQLLLVGPPDHAATNPISSQAPGRATVVDTPAKTATVGAAGGPVSYLLQPGFALEAAAPIVSALRSRYPAARPAVPAESCYAASDRAGTIYSVALGSDLMLVVGDPQSSDARHVCALARDAGTKVQLIGNVDDIKPTMLTSVLAIGMAESTSAPAGLAARVLDALSGLGRLTVARRRLSTEKTAGALG
jgi:4-hydroxy-3-methylbut-2-en-1-yl diphosphate reductase